MVLVSMDLYEAIHLFVDVDRPDTYRPIPVRIFFSIMGLVFASSFVGSWPGWPRDMHNDTVVRQYWIPFCTCLPRRMYCKTGFRFGVTGLKDSNLLSFSILHVCCPSFCNVCFIPVPCGRSMAQGSVTVPVFGSVFCGWIKHCNYACCID